VIRVEFKDVIEFIGDGILIFIVVIVDNILWKQVRRGEYMWEDLILTNFLKDIDWNVCHGLWMLGVCRGQCGFRGR
jgi:hypothetical protein